MKAQKKKIRIKTPYSMIKESKESRLERLQHSSALITKVMETEKGKSRSRLKQKKLLQKELEDL